jgi:hypothetical protein
MVIRQTYTATSDKKLFLMDSRSGIRSVLISTVSDGKDNRFPKNNIKYKKSKKKNCISLKSTNITVLRVFNQNTRRLRNTTDELISPMHPNSAHTLRLTKRHIKQLEIKQIHIENYKLGT